ncbi:MAG TPA: hypothetical protein VNT02_06290 [Burkholderiales bacterium]|nr:hypothetical protein [Burkholderiales bacterium]
MKKLIVQIAAELNIPDDWQLVEHPGGMQVLKVGDKFVDFDITPLATTSSDPNATWTDEDQELTSRILDAVTDLDADMTIELQH